MGCTEKKGSLLMKYFYAIIKKNYETRQQKKDERPGYDVASWRRKQKRSWSSKLPSFFIFLVARYKNVSPHQVIISKIRVFTRFLRARVRPLSHFNLLFFCDFPSVGQHTQKAQSTLRKLRKVVRGGQTERQQQQQQLRPCVNTLTVPCALSSLQNIAGAVREFTEHFIYLQR